MVIENNKVPSLSKVIDEASETTEVSDHKLEAVVSGGVEVRHQSGIGRFFRQLFAEDMAMVKQTFVEDVLKPFVQDGLSGIFHDGVDLLIYGGRGRRGRRSGRELFSNQRTRYDKISRSSLDRCSSLRRSSDRDDEDDVEAYDDDLFVFVSRSKAEDVYNAMEDAIEMYKAVSVADLYDLAGVSNPKGDFTNRNWGWTSTEDIKIRRRGGKYILDLPKPENIRDVR